MKIEIEITSYYVAQISAHALLEKNKIEAIIGGQTRMEAKFLAELGEEAEVPVISLSEPISSPALNKYHFVVQITQDEISQFRGMAATFEAFNLREVILIYEETDIGRDVTYLIDSFQEKKIFVKHKYAIAASSVTDEKIIEELQKILTLKSTIFVVHVTQQVLVSQLFTSSKKLGMMSEGYAWFLTATTMHLLHSVDLTLIESMQGVVGLKSHLPASKNLDNLTSSIRRKFYIENPNIEVRELFSPTVLAYDSSWALAEAAERARAKLAAIGTRHEIRLNSLDLDKIESSKHGSILLDEILSSRFLGLSGQFQFMNKNHAFEIVNIIGRGERTVGVWTDYTFERTSQSSRGRHLRSNDLEAIIWPGGSTAIPKGRSMKTKEIKLRIGVPVKRGFKELVRVNHDHQSNRTYVTGFCIDVFLAAVNLLPYQVQYEFIPFENASGLFAGKYNALVEQVFLQVYMCVVLCLR